MTDDREEMTKRALKEALKEWLDERFALFGKWSFAAAAALLLAGAVYFILISQGWYK